MNEYVKKRDVIDAIMQTEPVGVVIIDGSEYVVQTTESVVRAVDDLTGIEVKQEGNE